MKVTLNNGKKCICTGVERRRYIYSGNSYNLYWIAELGKFVEKEDIYSFDGRVFK